MSSEGATPPRGGFTLIELTLAMILLAVALLALVGALGRALHESEAARLGHAALRHVESIADSLVVAGNAQPGVAVRAGLAIEWTPLACAAGTCVRVKAVPLTASDTFAVLVLTASAPR